MHPRHSGIVIAVIALTAIAFGGDRAAEAGDDRIQVSQSSLKVTPIRPTQNNLERSLRYVEVPIARYCKAVATEADERQYEDQILGRAAASDLQSGRVTTSAFFSAKVISVQIEADGADCGRECHQALEESIVRSFALWRAGCSRCRAESLNLLVVGSSVWLDVVTWDKWQYALSAGLHLPEHDPNAVSRMHLRPYGFQPLADYRKLNATGLQRAACENRDRIDIDAAVRRIACAATAPVLQCVAPACMDFPIGLGRNQSRCDLTKRIACGSPDGAVGLNTDEFTFEHTISASGLEVRIGQGNLVPLDYAITHEMGHWFGLNHDKHVDPTGKRNMMRDGFSPTRDYCITELNLTSLDNAVDKSWDFRLVDNSGLRWVDD
jgi:hypothetical protein